MLSPDVPEFVPRGFEASNALAGAREDSNAHKHVSRGYQASNTIIGGRGDPRFIKHVSQRKMKQAPLESSSMHGLQSQPGDIGHNRSGSLKYNWRNVSRDTLPKDGGEGSGKPKFKRYGNADRGITNGRVFQPEGNSRNIPPSFGNWRDSKRPKDGPAEKTTKGSNGGKKSNFFNSTGRDWSGKYHKVQHDPGKGRGRLQTSRDYTSNENYTKYKVNPTVREEEYPHPRPATATRYREGLSYGNIVRSNSNKGNLPNTEPVTTPEMSLMLDDQWPSLGDTHSQAMPWVKRNVKSNTSQSVANAWPPEKNDTTVKERNQSKEYPWHVKVLNRPTDEKVTPKVGRVNETENKPLGTDKECKDRVTEIRFEESNRKEIRGCGKSNSEKIVHDQYGKAVAKRGKNEQKISVNAISLHEKPDSTARRDTREGIANTVQEHSQSDSESRETDPFQWQVKIDKKKRTKPNDPYNQQDKLDKPVDMFSKDTTSGKNRNLRSDNSLLSIRNMSKEEYRKYKKDDVSHSFQLKNSVTDKIWSKKEKREKKELVRKSSMRANRVFKEEASGRESDVELEGVQNSGSDRVSAPIERCDTEIPVAAEGTDLSVTEHQKRVVGEETSQRIKVIKRKRKEEKMRKKEEKLLKARELKKLDSKVTIITRDFLESALFDSTNKRKPNSSVSNRHKLKLFSEEYPSLVRGGTAASRIAFEEDVFETTLEESDDASVTDEPEADSNLSANESSGALETALPAGVPSYSRVLLAAKRDVKKKPSPQKVKENIPTKDTDMVVQKKKVRANDLIELDLMAAALLSRKNKKKDLTDAKEAKTELKTSKKKTAQDSPNGTSGKTTRGTTAPSVHTKAKEGANVKRGKQREGQKKKKISRLKKCMQRARQLEVETLLSILQEAKKAQEKSASSNIQEIRTPSNLSIVPEVEATVTESSGSENNKEPTTVSASLDVHSDLGVNEDNKVKDADPRCDVDSNDKQEVHDLKNVPDELSHGEVSDPVSNGVSVSVTEPTGEVFDGKCEPEIQANVKDNSEVTLEADSTLKGKEDSNLYVKPACDGMNLTVPSEIPINVDENKTGLDSGTSDQEKLGMEESVTLECHHDPETPKKFLGVIEELKALQNPIHKKKFREYCNHVITPEVDLITKELVESLVNFQTRHFQRDPTKARIRRRYVCGLKETTKLMGKMSCIVVAPDIQRSKGPGALDEVVEKMLEQARIHGVPVIFALSCKRLGKLCFKKVPVSCFGIINYQGAQDKFQTLMQLVPEAQKQYRELIAYGSRSVPVDDEEEEEIISKENELEKSDVNKEVIAKTLANISGIVEE